MVQNIPWGRGSWGIYLPAPIPHWLKAATRGTKSPALLTCPRGTRESLQVKRVAVGSHHEYTVARATGLG